MRTAHYKPPQLPPSVQPYKLNRRSTRGKGRGVGPIRVEGSLIWDSSRAGTYRKPKTIERQNARVRSVRGSAS